MLKKTKQLRFYLLAPSAIGILALLLITRWGIGSVSDSAIYIGAARNLLAGRGLTVPFGAIINTPMTHYPPLFPALLAATGLVGVDPIHGARWLQAFLLGANIFLVGLIVARYTHNSFWAPTIAAFLTLSSSVVLMIHAWAISEPLFIFFGVLGFVLLSDYLEHKKPALLVGSAAATALAFLSRYTGAALVATGLAALILFPKRPRHEKLRDCVVFAGISVIPIALWAVRNLQVAGSAANRQVFVHPISSVHFQQALVTIATWATPPRVPASIAAVILCAGVGCLAVLHFVMQRHHPDETPRPRILHILVIFIAGYAALLVFSISFFDAHTTLDSRILSPIHVALLIIIVGMGNRAWNGAHKCRALKMGMLVAAFLFCSFHVYRGGAWAFRTYTYGLGFATETWRDNEFIRQVEALPANAPIYSNGMDAVYILAGRPCRNLPAKMSPVTLQPNPHYAMELSEMKQELDREDGAIVYFKGNIHRRYFPTEAELTALLPLRPVVEMPEGSIYRIDRIP
ncbi:MAG: hypothetical protein Kow0099_36750 [Candidatus Abyssubacteria bacterium]